MELDITSLEYTYIFLNELQIQGFICENLIFKVVSRLTNKISYVNFANLEDFFNRYSILITDTSPNKYCKVGDFIFLEQIKFINRAVRYNHCIRFYNIADGNIFSKNEIEYNNKKNSFFRSDKKKFVAYLKYQLSQYFERNSFLKQTRQDSYVDACYVDPKYVGPAGFVPADESLDDDLE